MFINGKLDLEQQILLKTFFIVFLKKYLMIQICIIIHFKAFRIY